MIVGGIVTFNPNLERINRNIKRTLEQVKYLIIFDNNSINKEELSSCVEQYNEDRIFFIKNECNIGLSGALNQIFVKSIELNADWTLTLDQDSILPYKYTDFAKQYFNIETIGIICPLVYDINVKKILTKSNGKNNQYVNRCITSASIIRNNIWKLAGKFDEKFFIDYVDFDFCMRVRNKGYKIIQLNNFYFDHELGNSIIKKVGPFSFRVSNHNSERRYYMVRNIILYIKKYKKNIVSELLRIIKIYIFVIFFEKDKKKKIINMNKGLVDGICSNFKKVK